jgi:DNA helicase-2/ATP-dependent DNA helicase PcrA
LCYVGVTRAKQRLYLVRAFRRSLMGSSNLNRPSRFLEELPRHLVTSGGLSREEGPAIYSWNQAPAADINVPELKAGDRVRHAAFGEGVVVSCRPVRDDAEVVAVFNGVGLKKLLLSFARLEKMER